MVSAKSALKEGPAPTTTGGKVALAFKRWLAAGCAMSCAEITMPIDTAKVRLQIQSKGGELRYKGLFDCLKTMAREEGMASWYRGLPPALARQLVYGGLRLCMYDPVRNFYHNLLQKGEGHASLVTKIAAGLTTGALAMCVAQPTDVVKIRFQAEGSIAQGGRYKNMADAFVKIAKADGVAGLWRGLGPNVARNATINAAELATYDQIKQVILDTTPLNDGATVQWLAAFGAGFVAVCIGSPIDVVKTRIMNSKPLPDGSKPYSGMVDAFVKIGKTEGPLAFYNGFWPNFARLGSWSVVMFMSYEKIKMQFRGPLNYEKSED